MTPVRADELRRDFVRSRQNAFLGWPDARLYNAEDRAYFAMLESERLAGRLEIEGTIKTLVDYPEIPE